MSAVARIFLLSLITLIPVFSFAGVDKSGVKPNVISLPSGPGSIEGLGESFEPQLNSGTASYRIPLKLPDIRGTAPELALEYNSGYGNGPVGMGWRLNIPAIQRQTDKGLPLYQDGDTFTEWNGEELVPVDTGSTFRCENEAGPSAFGKFRKMGDGSWLLLLKNGNRMTFGSAENARQSRKAGEIFRWMISAYQNPNGSRAEYSYIHDSGQIYISEIRYGFHQSAPSSEFLVRFDYEDNRPDPVTDYRGRFRCETRKRLRGITVFAGSRRLRHWQLTYAEGSHSLLAEVRMFGDERSDTGSGAQINRDFLPPLKLGYTPVLFAPSVYAAAGLPLVSFRNGEAELADINSDGLPDILLDDQGTYKSVMNRGQGNSWSAPQPFNFSPSARLRDSTTQIADLNGNGRPTLLVKDMAGLYYLPFRDFHTFGTDTDFFIPGFFPVDDPDVRFTDVNNDKAMDMMATDPDEFSFLINKNSGRQNYFLENPPAPPASGIRFSQGWRLADMNGDRLQDLVRPGTREDGGTVFYAGMGWGEFDTQEVIPGGPGDADVGMGGAENLFLSDLNRDGLSDLVFIGSGIVKYWLNLNGREWDEGREMTAGIPDYAPDIVAIRFADMNGNGSTDIVWNRTDMGGDHVIRYLDLFSDEKPFQLKRIENGIGRRIEIDYATSTSFMVADMGTDREWTSVVPFPVDVVSAYTVYDGRGNQYRTVITYHNGYYDGEEKEFRGFERAEKREIGDGTIPDLVMAYAYDTGAVQDALKGKPLNLSVKNASGQAFYQETYKWQTRKLADGANGDTRDVTFPYQEEKTRTVLEKGNGVPVTLKWEYGYDDFGNMTRQYEHGRTDAGWDDERITETAYTAAYPSGQSAWILDKVVETTVTDENGAKVRHQRSYFDNLPLGQVSRGNLTKTEDWISGSRYAVSARNDYDTYGNVVATYDALHGQKPGHWREIIYDSEYHTFPEQEIIHTGDTTLTLSAAYDYGLGVLTSSTDFNGHTTTYGYDTFGRLVHIIKPPDAGHTVAYDYVLAHDMGGGRLINWVETRQRDGSAGDGFLHSRTFYDGLGRKIMTRAEGEEPGQIVVTDTLQFNARKQPRKTYLPYFEAGTLAFAEPTFNTGFTEHFYDALGREIRVNQPAGPDGTLFSKTEYQPLVRIVRDEEQTNPASKHFGCGMKYVEDGLQDKDGKGRLREVYEIVKLNDTGESLSGTVSWKTAYAYDLLDKLTQITDSRNNQKFMQYDGVGRKTFMNDPDRGTMDYRYDDAGNLVSTTDAKGQVIRYEYDGVNRLTGEYYGDTGTTPDVAYHYDAPYGSVDKGTFWSACSPQRIADAILQEDGSLTACDLNRDDRLDVADAVKAATGAGETVIARNLRGFLSWVEDASGEEHNSYDERGRVEWVVKRIAGNNGLNNFYTAMDYDAMDRVTRLTYPDQSHVAYSYNSRGLLESVPGVIEQYDFNPSGQNALLTLACGTRTEYAYDHRLRLTDLRTRRQGDGLLLQDLTYTFDGVSNITGITDGRSDTVLAFIGGELGLNATEAGKFNATQSFAYDSLYRLTRAENPAVYGTISYRYDRIGNMIAKNAVLNTPDALMDLGVMTCGGTAGTSGRIGRNAGDQPGPHAITGTQKGPDGAMAFTYDANGNMTTDRGMTLTWDVKDRLNGIAKGAMNAAYAYDYTDTRKQKTVTDGNTGQQIEVLYVDKYSEVRDGKLVKYVYAGNSRVARVESSGAEPGELEPEAFYLHDHLGSTSFTLFGNGAVQEQLVNYPFGQPRLEKRVEDAMAGADYKFTGKEQDVESGLQYFEARYYSGILGRFNRVDPLAGEMTDDWLMEPQRLNLYVYGMNKPSHYVDKDGKFAETILDVVSLGESIYSMCTAPSWTNAGLLAWDVVGLVPGVPGSWAGKAIKYGGKALEMTKYTGKGLTYVQETKKLNKLLTATNDHHLFPRQFEKFFKDRGIEINKYTVTLEQTTHLKGIHGKGLGNLPGKWNKQWEKFINNNQNATSKEIGQQLRKMMKQYGLGDLPVHPYKK